MKEIERKIAESSFGTARATAARRTVPSATAARIVARSAQIRSTGSTKSGGK